MKAFPNEVASTYFIPSQMQQAARGKLWNAYNKQTQFLRQFGYFAETSEANET
ncbi:hypothetical protein DOY81_009881 [Sarcophaga bullata]|nr:hypothetical protein DOY81_009881 [Sarcophaga bullata]